MMKKALLAVMVVSIMVVGSFALNPSLSTESNSEPSLSTENSTAPSPGTNTAPTVACVPWAIVNSTEYPHFILPGSTHTLKAVAKDVDGGSLHYRWDYESDGTWDSSGIMADPQPAQANNPYNLEATTTYTGSDWDIIYATVAVSDDGGVNWVNDTYYIAIRDPSDNRTRFEIEINMAIDQGLWRLQKTQRVSESGSILSGYWPAPYSSYYMTSTAPSVESFENNGHLPTGDVNEDPYVETVQRGLNWIFTKLYKVTKRVQSQGNPDTNNNSYCLSVVGNRPTYEQGMAMMAIAGSQAPNLTAQTGISTYVQNRTYKDILTDMVDMCALGQTDRSWGRGGWNYYWNSGYYYLRAGTDSLRYSSSSTRRSDNSITQWPTIGLAAAEQEPWNISAPTWVKTEMSSYWIPRCQYTGYYDVGPSYYEWHGGFGYTGSSWPTCLRTGSGLCQMAYTGFVENSSRVQMAKDFLGNDDHWQNSNSYTGVWGTTTRPHLYSMYAIMKGARLFEPSITDFGTHDWYWEEWDPWSDPWSSSGAGGMARFLVNIQQSSGAWPNGYRLNTYATTPWSILILTPTLFTPPPVAVAKPTPATSYEGLPVLYDGTGSYHMDPNKYIAKYEFDFDDDGTYDYYEEWTDLDGDRVVDPGEFSAPDGAFDAKTESSFFNDDFTGYWRLRVSDNSDPPMDDDAVAEVFIYNLDPTIDYVEAEMCVEVGLRVAGSKWSNVLLTLYADYGTEDEAVVGTCEVERWPGSPNSNPSISTLPTGALDLTKAYTAVITYDPYPDEDDPINGDQPNNGNDPFDNAGNPVWLTLDFCDGTSTKIHHTFNTQQSMIKDSDHWNHVEPWVVPLTSYFVGHPVNLEAQATDPGSDDLTFAWSFSTTTTYFNDGVGTDPYPSYWYGISPFTAVDTPAYTYIGPVTITLIVSDDDGGSSTTTLGIG